MDKSKISLIKIDRLICSINITSSPYNNYLFDDSPVIPEKNIF
jgi:hypothetical protein